MSVSYESICQSLGGGLIGGFAGASAWYCIRTIVIPGVGEIRAGRRRRKDMGGMDDLEMTHFHDGLPEGADRRAFGQMLAYLVEMGPVLGKQVQSEAHEIIRHKARDEPYVLTPETARWMICMAGITPPNSSEVWELIDEACDLLGREHLERET